MEQQQNDGSGCVATLAIALIFLALIVFWYVKMT